jgi:hypothetical protein
MARSAPTIPNASASGKPELSIKKEDWLRIEKGYGHPLSDDVRERIREATTQLVYYEVFERNAEPLSAATGRVNSIKKATSNLVSALMAISSDAKVYADHLVKKHFSDPRLATPRDDLFHSLIGVLSSLSVACNLALKEMGNTNLTGYREGDRWDQWVRQLTKIAQESKIPFAASKGSDKATTYSAFILLVEALQNCVPASARRHLHSKAALAAAINRARKRAR